ncbi:MAG: DUF4912 domain-containing protein [Spirochaetota bacterium]
MAAKKKAVPSANGRKAVKKPKAEKKAAPKKAPAAKKAVHTSTDKKKIAAAVAAVVKAPAADLKVVASSVKIAESKKFHELDFVDRVRELPERYSDTRLIVAVRDPQWCFAYWDIANEDFEKHHLSDKPLHLKIYRLLDPDNIEHKFQHMDVEVNRHYGSWYIMLGMPDNYFIGELGYYDADGNFIMLARSRVFHAPRDAFSNVFDEEWMLTDDMAKVLYGEFDPNGLSSASMINLFKKYIVGGDSSFLLSGASSSGFPKQD